MQQVWGIPVFIMITAMDSAGFQKTVIRTVRFGFLAMNLSGCRTLPNSLDSLFFRNSVNRIAMKRLQLQFTAIYGLLLSASA